MGTKETVYVSTIMKKLKSMESSSNEVISKLEKSSKGLNNGMIRSNVKLYTKLDASIDRLSKQNRDFKN